MIQAPRELVLASAGTGKTYRITSRLISLLAYGEEPDQLLASSFTRKAAGEILQRTLARLARAALDDGEAADLSDAATLPGAPPLPAERAFWAALLERVVRRLHRLDVGTLDAFFIRAAGAFQQELGLPPGWGIVDEPSAMRMRSEVLQDVLRAMEGEELIELLRLANRGGFHRSVHDRLLSQLEELLKVNRQLDPAVPDPWRAFGDADGDPPDADERNRLGDALDAFPLPGSKGKPNGHWVKEVARLSAAIREGDWAAVVAKGLCRTVLDNKAEYQKQSIEDVLPVLEPVIDAARTGLRGRYSPQVVALGHLVERFEAALNARQAAAGAFRFEDVTRLLGGDAPLARRDDLYYRLDARTKHILLDEFQDTSLAQWEALEPLVDEVLSEPGARAGVIVADPKQSIYGWRGAEPGIVHGVGARYVLPREQLALSRRSSDVVLGLVNQVFERAGSLPSLEGKPVCASAARDWLADFHRHASANADLPGYARIEVGPPDEGRGSARPNLCAHAADLVVALRAAAPGRSIGVLTRTNGTVGRMILELRARGVPASEEGGNPLTDSGSCEAVLALLRLADHPGDTVARYHVSRTPLGRLLGYVDHRADAAPLARTIRARVLEQGYGDWLAGIARLLATECDARELRRLFQLVELGFRYEGGATLRPADFVRLAEAERVEDPVRAEVRVMTVHQSKGLEFDMVVLPELDRPLYRAPNAPVFPWRPGPLARVQAVLPSVPKDQRCLFPDVEAAYAQAEAAAVRDGLSGLYVALTRAKHAVHIVVAPDGENGPGSALTAARIVREALPQGLVEASHGDVLYEAGDPGWHEREARTGRRTGGEPPSSERAPVRLTRQDRQRLVPRRSPSELEGDSRVDLRVLLRLEHGAAMSRGTIVHAWFERIAWIEDPPPTAAELRRVAREIDPDVTEGDLDALIRDFRAWMTLPAIQDALSREAYADEPEVRAESRFIAKDEKGLIEGSIDRLVLLRRGGRVVGAEVLDYKTDRFDGDETLIASRVEHYRPQLLAYAGAVRRIHRLDAGAVRARLVLLDAGRVVDVAE